MVSDIDRDGGTNRIGVFFIGIGKEPELQRLAAPGEPRIGVGVGSGYGDIGNVLVAESHAGKPGVQRLDQWAVGAIVRRHLSL